MEGFINHTLRNPIANRDLGSKESELGLGEARKRDLAPKLGVWDRYNGDRRAAAASMRSRSISPQITETLIQNKIGNNGGTKLDSKTTNYEPNWSKEQPLPAEELVETEIERG